MNALSFLTYCLAVFRLARMITSEAGPGWIIKYLRQAVKREAPKKAHMDEGIECFLCMSMQVGLVVATLSFFFHGNPLFDILILALALSGGGIILNQLTKTND